ncbi:hypothetical protein [Sulfoacidibacillus thermotolerans]|uniref:Uncharacterized protein n=1 Tax=Sulfoacidibacillus thermotolerans TaxID=1765684 RepID=A0A2U3DCC2_SULT2|nr:hypothetical protein [Sulfoacidibacillus thermotolerans]PWI58934.1 hypothetical protein BM613_02335 [Sulfoacidibacillus thermotolerans]
MKNKNVIQILARTLLATGILSLSFFPIHLCSAANTPANVSQPMQFQQQQPKPTDKTPNTTDKTPNPAEKPQTSGYDPMISGKGYGNLRVKVIDGRTLKPIEGAEVVVLETEKRYKTDANGLTPWIQAPVLRSARFRFLVNELHGQLTLISYKNGYHDSIHMGVRMNEGATTKTTIWQYQITPGVDRRLEPIVYIEPYHRLWLIQLADRFRRPSQLGEGYERP